MNLDYYYKNESDKYSFIRIPKAMMTGELYASLSIQAKILYGLLLDRLGEAAKNSWLDDDNKVYVIYQLSEIMNDMNVSKGKAISALTELEEIGLIEKIQMGMRQPSRIYVKNFVLNSDV